MAHFYDLPREIALKLLSFLSYDELSKLRQVSTHINSLCMLSLNTGFSRAEVLHASVLKEIRSKLPKRESERRSHALSRHADILSAIETRMSLLQITYSKYIESGYCCFIPGKVLDELFSVLRFVRTESSPPRSHEVLMELRDISSMAMEHFEEKILPPLRKQLIEDGVAVLPGGLTVGIDNDSFRKQDLIVKRPAPGSSFLPSPACKRPRLSPSFHIHSPSKQLPLQESQKEQDDSMSKRLAEAERIISQQGEQIEEQTRSIEEMTKKLSEYNHRFNDLAEVLKLNFPSGNVHEKITALIERPDDSSELNASTSSETEGFTKIVSRTSRRQLSIDKKNPAVLRANRLKEQLDLFRDEYKL